MYGTQKVRGCANCDKIYDNGLMFKCGRCRVQYYCSVECQKANWSTHKPFCNSLKTIAPDYSISNVNHPINKKVYSIIGFIKSNIDSRISLYEGAEKHGVYVINLHIEKLDAYLDIIKSDYFPVTKFLENPNSIHDRIDKPVELPFDVAQDQTIHDKEIFEMTLTEEIKNARKEGYLFQDLIKVYIQIVYKDKHFSGLTLLIPNYLLLGSGSEKVKVNVLHKMYNELVKLSIEVNKK